jgi:hypothetical protein
MKFCGESTDRWLVGLTSNSGSAVVEIRWLKTYWLLEGYKSLTAITLNQMQFIALYSDLYVSRFLDCISIDLVDHIHWDWRNSIAHRWRSAELLTTLVVLSCRIAQAISTSTSAHLAILINVIRWRDDSQKRRGSVKRCDALELLCSKPSESLYDVTHESEHFITTVSFVHFSRFCRWLLNYSLIRF